MSGLGLRDLYLYVRTRHTPKYAYYSTLSRVRTTLNFQRIWKSDVHLHVHFHVALEEVRVTELLSYYSLMTYVSIYPYQLHGN